MQLVYAKVYLIPEFVDNMYKMFKAVIRFGESWANKWTNLGINDAFYIDYWASLSKERL